MSLRLPSPAKVNLCLRVVGKRADGYHQLVSVMQTLKLADFLTFEPAMQDLLICSDPSIPTDENNLVSRALKLFKQETGFKECFKIELKKKIPAEAGLGGGSGNAATTLFALNKLANSPLTNRELLQFSAKIGSDVPFFFSTGTALVTGRGEHVANLAPIKLPKISLIKPPFGLSTAQVFGALPKTFSAAAKYENAYSRGELDFMNDLENGAFSISPKLLELKEQLQSCGFDQVVMSGSGSSFLCLGNGELPYFDGYKMFFAEPINRSSDEWYEIEEEEDETV